jgi:hypothetical protein
MNMNMSAEELGHLIEDAERWRYIAMRLFQIEIFCPRGKEFELTINSELAECTKAQADAAVDKAREGK